MAQETILGQKSLKVDTWEVETVLDLILDCEPVRILHCFMKPPPHPCLVQWHANNIQLHLFLSKADMNPPKPKSEGRNVSVFAFSGDE